MNLIENKTKFTHKSMSSWGVGVFRESEGDYITVEFENAGIKKFTKATINSMLMPVGETLETVSSPSEMPSSAVTTYALVNDQNSSLVQFDGESRCIAGKNIIESFESNDSVIFNETYIVVGEHTKALKIHALRYRILLFLKYRTTVILLLPLVGWRRQTIWEASMIRQ